MNEWRELKIMLKALGDMARLTIVYHLVHHKEITVTELTDLLGISQPLVSWHLRKLKRANLITTRRVGRQVYCSLNTNSFELCIQGLERLMDPANSLESFPLDPALLEAEVSFEDQ
jgi:ArsR family transcriptional regulator, arsenate/arsenite/antimonite-responsive transcriptional repressor